ncbi:hypothetical protein [Acetobacterium wieringae]|uniref:hypothetical protein n=1 Tax=Acetobacterium wieringae TaxID=52694 RepID=UPI0020338BEF|nr:hypothetical protein [Acetobacterium wieringae]URN83511.1 hypothetical protein CHL1_002650 [Acetobacterium wieringae]
MKKNRTSDEDKIQYLKMMSLYERESKRQKGDEKFRKMINRFRKSIKLEPEYLEEET